MSQNDNGISIRFSSRNSSPKNSIELPPSDSTLEHKGSEYTSEEVNRAGVELVKKVAGEGNALTAGSISRSWGYGQKSKAVVQEEFRKQAKIFVENDMDLIICEVTNKYAIKISQEITYSSSFILQFFDYVEEAEWAIEVCTEFDLPIAATMAIGPQGDWGNVSAGDCAGRRFNRTFLA